MHSEIHNLCTLINISMLSLKYIVSYIVIYLYTDQKSPVDILQVNDAQENVLVFTVNLIKVKSSKT